MIVLLGDEALAALPGDKLLVIGNHEVVNKPGPAQGLRGREHVHTSHLFGFGA